MSITYRPEIDGLRAVAVIAVVLYHAEFIFREATLFTGGFIGVDIFFVISGYLITSLILKDLREGDFSFLRFYERRVRRILPALFLVMLVSIPFAWRLLLPVAMDDYAGSILSSLAFGSNFWFVQGEGYWAEPSALKPFLHTWSLSVEEQFYVVFPPLLLFLWRFSRDHLLSVFSIGIVLSLCVAEFAFDDYREFTFYLLPARAWELLAGAFLAKLEIDRGRGAPSGFFLLMPLLGVILIVYSIIYFDSETKHPSLFTLIPILGTMLFIWFSRKGELITDLFGSRAFVGIGLISYSLYLWHFPIFAFARIENGIPSSANKLLWILVSLGLSIITYYLVERPFRSKSAIGRSSLLFTLCLATMVIAGFSYSALVTEGFGNRLPGLLGENFVQQPWTLQKNDSDEQCMGNTKFCTWTAPGNTRTALLVGDSNLASIDPYLTPRLLSSGYNVVSMTSSACYFMPEFYSIGKDGKPRVSSVYPCGIEYQSNRLAAMEQHPGATIILAGKLAYYLREDTGGFEHPEKKSVEEGYVEAVNELLEKGFRVLQLGPTPRSKTSVSQTLLNQLNSLASDDLMNLDHNAIIRMMSFPTEDFDAYAADAFDLLSSIEHVNYSLVFPHKLFCDSLLLGSCVVNNGTEIYLVDTNHPSQAGAEIISDFVVEKLQNWH